MKNFYSYFLIKSILFILILISEFISSQTITSQLDKKRLKIGEQTQFTVRISAIPKGSLVMSAPKNELLPFHFEELNDSIKITPDQYERIIQFSVFEEGKFTIPELEFKVGNQILKTISYDIEVINTSQPTDQISDIRTNIEVELSLADYWEMYKFYVFILLLFIAIVFIIIVFFKYRRKPKDTPQEKTNKTLKLLDILLAKKYIEKQDYRLFYVELLEITRNFINLQYGIPADVLLTEDLLPILKNNNMISIENEKIIEEVFTRGDLVKFAKVFPDTTTMENDFQSIYNFVKNSIKDLEIENLREGV